MARRIGEGGRWRSGAGGAASGLTCRRAQGRRHLGGADSGIWVDGRASGVLRRLMAHVDGSVVGIGGSRVFVDGSLHLLEDVVDLLEVVLGPEVRHGRKIVVLGKGPSSAADSESVRRLGHVLGS